MGRQRPVDVAHNHTSVVVPPIRDRPPPQGLICSKRALSCQRWVSSRIRSCRIRARSGNCDSDDAAIDGDSEEDDGIAATLGVRLIVVPGCWSELSVDRSSRYSPARFRVYTTSKAGGGPYGRWPLKSLRINSFCSKRMEPRGEPGAKVTAHVASGSDSCRPNDLFSDRDDDCDPMDPIDKPVF